MKKGASLLHYLSTLALISLTLWISSCHAQPSQTAHWSNDYSKQISQVVRKVFQDSQGNLWFGTQNGAFLQRGDSLIHIDGIKSEIGKRVTIKDITEGKDGKIWFGHSDGISSLDGEKLANYYESDGLISRDVWNIEADARGNLWIGTIDGACVFDGQKFTPFDLPEGIIDTTLGISSTKMVHCILEDSKGHLWFCTNAGLFKYTDNSLVNVSGEVGIQSNFVNEIAEDQQGGLWISTKNALYKLSGDSLDNITKDIPDLGKGIGSIELDSDGTLWFVFNQHYLYTYGEGKLTEFKKPEDSKGPVVYQIFSEQNGRLWFVGFGGAFRLENGRFVNVTKEGPW